jgi:phosphoglycerate dehydrogenase-like enzyme
MSEIGVIDSSVRAIPVGLFRKLLNGYSIKHIRLTSGDISTTIGLEHDLRPLRALYVRVGSITADIIDRAPDLELVATCGSGYDHIDVGAATEAGVMVTHTPGAPAPGVVEHTFGVMFSIVHRLPEMFEITTRDGWAEGQTTVGEVYGKRIGVIGLGTIGSRIAKIAEEQFGADVLAYDPYVSGERESPVWPRTSRDEMTSCGVTLTSKRELFEQADIVTIHVPLTESTRGMVGRGELDAIEGGYLINTSRGEIVDESALIEAVEAGKIAGVGLDVMTNEPPDSNNPLLNSPRVYVTPHIAGGTDGYVERSARINAERISRVLRGERPDSLVNPEVID